MLGQEAVPDKAGEVAAVPVLLARLADNNGLRGALVSIDAIATNANIATIATAIQDAGADYLLAVKAKHSIRLRRKLATWTPAYLETLLNSEAK